MTELTDEMAGKLIKAICKYAMTGKLTETDSTVKAIFASIQPIMDRDCDKYKAKVERIAALNKAKSERNRDEIVTKSTRNRDEIVGVNVNDNVNVNVNDIYNIYIVEIVNYLNEKTHSNYKPNTAETKKHISGRLKEGYTVDDFKLVIDYKVEEWSDNEKMRQYLRPSTLFAPSKFEAYLQEAKKPKAVKKTSFGSHPQNTYDFAELEKKLISN